MQSSAPLLVSEHIRLSGMDVAHALELTRHIVSSIPAIKNAHIHNDIFQNDGGHGSLGKLRIARDILVQVTNLIDTQIYSITAGFGDLPSDVIIKIFEYLPADFIVENVRFVSKQWRKNTKSNMLWKSINKLYLYGSEFPLVFLLSKFSYSGSINKFRHYVPLVSQVFLFCESFSRHRTHFFSTNLHRLVLFRCSVDDSDLSFISMCCTKLKSLSLVDSGPVSDEGLLALGNLQHLRELTISRFDESSGFALSNPRVHHLTSLTSLILSGGGRDVGLILKNLTSLSELYYEDRTGDMDGWQFLTRLGSLQSLGIAFRSQIDLPQICRLFPTLAHVTQLRTLLFNPIFFSSNDTEAAIMFFDTLKRMPLLEYVGNLGEIPIDAWQHFPINSSIKRLSFCFTFFPNEKYLDTMISVCKQLSSLQVLTFGVFCADLSIELLEKFSVLTQLKIFYFCVSDSTEAVKYKKELQTVFSKWLPTTKLIITSPENIAEFEESVSDMKLIINIP